MRDVVPGKMRLNALSFQVSKLEVELIYKLFVPENEVRWGHRIVPVLRGLRWCCGQGETWGHESSGVSRAPCRRVRAEPSCQHWRVDS